jgi:hypothetical protein
MIHYAKAFLVWLGFLAVAIVVAVTLFGPLLAEKIRDYCYVRQAS